MDDTALDQGREAAEVQEAQPLLDGAASLLNELTGVFDDLTPPKPPQPPVPAPAAAVNEEVIVASPPRIEPPVMIWKPERRMRLRLRRR
jgi:hypothetical protein